MAEVTFNFWYRLSEALFKTENDDKIALFRPYFETLIEALCVHCRLEADAVSNQFVNSLTFVVKFSLAVFVLRKTQSRGS